MLPYNAPLRCMTAHDLAIIQPEPLTLRTISCLKSALKKLRPASMRGCGRLELGRQRVQVHGDEAGDG